MGNSRIDLCGRELKREMARRWNLYRTMPERYLYYESKKELFAVFGKRVPFEAISSRQNEIAK